MEFLKKVTQRLQQVRETGRLLKEDGLINTTDLLVATAATVVLAAGVGGTVLSTLDESKYGKAQPDAQAVGQAIMTFYKDTGKWPGQTYHSVAANQSKSVLLATGSVSSVYDLPAVANNGLDHEALPAATKCGANSGQGFVNGTIGSLELTTSDNGTVQLTTSSTNLAVLNLNDFLVRRPTPAVDYPNWGGPYVQEIQTDPWDRSWVAYLAPLYCSEAVTETTTTGGTTATNPINNGAGRLGYAWLLSGGTNRTITTSALSPNLDPNGDDTGVQMGKLTVQ